MLYRWMLRPTQHVRNRSTTQIDDPPKYLSEILEWSSYFSFLYASVHIFPSFMFPSFLKILVPLSYANIPDTVLQSYR